MATSALLTLVPFNAGLLVLRGVSSAMVLPLVLAVVLPFVFPPGHDVVLG